MSEQKEETTQENKSVKKNFIKDLVGNFDYKDFYRSCTKVLDDSIDAFDKGVNSAEKLVLKSEFISNKSGFFILMAIYLVVLEALRFFAFDGGLGNFLLSLWPIIFIGIAKVRNSQKAKEVKTSKSDEFLK